MPHQHTAEPREVFGPYLVFERLGVGGMATVHRAKKRGIEGFERVAALKRMLGHLAEDEQFVKAFVREAKLAALLQHSNIVQIYELGRVGRIYFISMEYVEGWDVRKILRQCRRTGRTPPVGVTLSIIGELLDALDYAHSRVDAATGAPLGLVHRDVSPSNLIVGHSGHLKVIDFGIAKATALRTQTDSGRVKGKLGYMSPESAQGKALDGRSDLFSAGIIAHELLTVRPLFASKSDYETLTRITQGAVEPPSAYNAAVPSSLDQLVLRALAKDPARRFPSAAAMREAIDEVVLRHKLPATGRQVADWLAETFAAAPADDAGRITAQVPAWRPPTEPPIPTGDSPLPVAEADDEIIEIVWGGRGDEQRPVLLEDVPDVSATAPAWTPEAAAARVALSRVSYRAPTVTRTPAPADASGTSVNVDLDDSSRGARRAAVMMAAAPIETTRITAVPPPPERPERPASFAVGTTPPPMHTPRAVRAPVRPPPRPQTAAQPPAAEAGATARPRLQGSGTTAAPAPAYLPWAIGIGGLVGAAAAALLFFALRGDGPPPPPPAPLPAAAEVEADPTVSFVIEPADAEIAIDGLPTGIGSPLELRLTPGTHDVAVSRTGYATWRTRLEVRAGEPQTVRVVLERRRRR